MNNKLLDMQNMLFNQMKRLDNSKMTMDELTAEVSRSNALSNNANTFIKSINVNIRVKELADKYNTAKKKIDKELGL